MINVTWSAVTGYVRHAFTAPHREPLIKKVKKDMVYDMSAKSLSPKKTFKGRESKGNHKWRLSQIAKELKRKRNG
jgi:hypothetical protein